MKTIPRTLALYAATGAALCAVLTGCKSEPGHEPDPKPGPAVSEPQSSTPGLSDTDLFLAAARAVSPELEGVPDNTLTDLGQSVCGAFDTGASSAEVGVIMIDSGMDATAAGAVVGAATSTLCPEHKDAARGV